MELRPLRSDDGMLIKRVRLRSLVDAPYAFGFQTFAEEAALPNSHWHQLAAQVGGQDPQWRDRCVSYVVLDGDDACGTATCYLCHRVPHHAYFTSAWIDPRYRRRGLGRQLVDAAIAWAAAHGAEQLRLWVDDTNPAAAEFYRALGFAPTGENRPVSEGSPDRQACFERRLKAG
jgi:ribosomal protein S18 acetylase RimI-like enzyme